MIAFLNICYRQGLLLGVSVPLLSHVQLFATPWTAARQASLSITNSQKIAQTHVHWVGDAIQPSHLLSHPSLPTFNLSQHQGFFPMSQFFSSGGQSIGAPDSASVLLKNIQDWFPLGLTGLISLQSKWLKGLLQYHNSEASFLWCSAFFIKVQLSHSYMTTGKTIALTRWTLVHHYQMSRHYQSNVSVF